MLLGFHLHDLISISKQSDMDSDLRTNVKASLILKIKICQFSVGLSNISIEITKFRKSVYDYWMWIIDIDI